MVRRFQFLLVLVALAILQTCWIHRLTLPALRPDLLFVLALFVGLKANRRAIVPTCIVIGLARDVFSVDHVGVGVLVCMAGGAAAWVVRRRWFSELALVTALTAFVVLLVVNWVYGAAMLLAHPALDINLWLKIAASQALITGLLTPALCRLFNWLGFVRPYREF
jgi:rod shape-determining protein MreD